MDVGFGLFAFIPVLIYLVILGLSIFVIVRMVTFMNEKTKLDRERNDKLDALIKAVQTNKEQ
ncbi:large-conductance mechanosensitive channel [Bacillus sp. SORGH_AS 510]|uniref:hypothetical protein n=1 Tax=Bacillus sp. SORGH_AS_0510 TaxID=3041771 RepID=UPI0027861E8D|nr:hypothetical protein [Bacillus sp. SORGH_AS_0510]MDQ1143749.1 large-conductance mechanosensitive channel [Bacillus sp. SORGH_AS_0510]